MELSAAYKTNITANAILAVKYVTSYWLVTLIDEIRLAIFTKFLHICANSLHIIYFTLCILEAT